MPRSASTEPTIHRRSVAGWLKRDMAVWWDAGKR